MNDRTEQAARRELRIDYMRLDRIRRDPQNTREHDLGALAESLKRFGFVAPMGMNEQTGLLLWGHGRLDDLERMMTAGQEPPDGIRLDPADGMWMAPVVRGVSLSEDDGAAYLIADNRIVELGGWNEPRLAERLSVLASSPGAADLAGTGFDAEDVEALIRALEPTGPRPPDPGPDMMAADALVLEYGVEKDSLWMLGSSRIMCGDAANAEAVSLLLGGQEPTAVLTDPPYGIGRSDIPNDSEQMIRQLYSGAIRAASLTSAVVIAFQSPRLFPIWLAAMAESGASFGRLLWWYEPYTPASGTRAYPWRGWYMMGEVICVGSVGDPPWPEAVAFGPDTYRHDPGSGGHTEIEGDPMVSHPTVKPLWIVEDLLAHTSGDVYDPFLGSGTTLIAAHRLGRRCFGMELEPRYVAVALRRWHQMTGEAPERLKAS